jgi:hypothetical protein
MPGPLAAYCGCPWCGRVLVRLDSGELADTGLPVVRPTDPPTVSP